MRLSFALLPVLAAFALAPAVTADGRKPGSVLVYPLQRSDLGFTLISVTNTGLQPATRVSFGDSTNLHFQYVNVVSDPVQPLRVSSCSIFDRIEYLTPADTMSVLTNCHNAAGFGGAKGYLVVSAENPGLAFQPWSHNKLIGHAIVATLTGMVYHYAAVPIRSLLPAGAPSAADGLLAFDGVAYETLPDMLYVDSFHTFFDQSLALANFTGGAQAGNQVYAAIWNDNEFALSTTFRFECWMHERLRDISTLFTPAFLASLPNDPTEIDCTCTGQQDAESGWFRLQSLGVFDRSQRRIATDGAMLGLLTAAPGVGAGAKLLWETGSQANGNFGVGGPTAPIVMGN